MILRSLSLIDFKNYSEASLELTEGVNCFVGPNGSGKTNLLDAVHYLSFCKSSINPIDSQNIREGRPFFLVKGEFEENGEDNELYCSMERNKKKRFKKDRREYERLADHIGRFPIVLIAPFDLDLVREGSEKRRRFMDGVISQYDHAYLLDLIRYNKALSHRNALLKRAQKHGERPMEELELWEEQMCDTGERIREARQRFVDAFVPIFRQMHGRIVVDGEDVGLSYKRSVEGGLREELERVREKDLVLGYSSSGPHREDLIFELGGDPLKKFGSQGQQKSFVLAMKLAQFHFVKDALGIVPILLLDDLFDKLDRERMKGLLELVSEEPFGQILITDTEKERLDASLAELPQEVRFFEVNAGKLNPWNAEATNVR